MGIISRLQTFFYDSSSFQFLDIYTIGKEIPMYST